MIARRLERLAILLSVGDFPRVILILSLSVRLAMAALRSALQLSFLYLKCSIPSFVENDLKGILRLISSVSGLSLEKLNGLEAQMVRMDCGPGSLTA